MAIVRPDRSLLVLILAFVAIVLIVPKAIAFDWCFDSDVERSNWQAGFIQGRLQVARELADVKVKVTDNVVHLGGVVSSDVLKALATEIALSANNVIDVKNRIRIVEGNSSPTQAQSFNASTGQLIDRALNNQVRSRLLTSDAIAGLDINVRTENRTVFLTGMVETEVEKELAYWIAANAKGVDLVINDLALRNRAELALP